MTAPLITIVEDSRDIRDLLSSALNDAGYTTKTFARATDFERAIPGLSPDLCIIDLGLPDKDGLALVARLAAETGAAILIISGRAGLQDKIVGLELGADDYITKPFEVAEVTARIKALLRRGRTVAQSAASFGGWTADLDQFLLTHSDGSTQRLSHAEAQVLRIFVAQPNRLVTRDQMLEALGDATVENYDRAIDVRVSRLRSKLRDDPQNPKIIKTIYGAGYIFIADIA